MCVCYSLHDLGAWYEQSRTAQCRCVRMPRILSPRHLGVCVGGWVGVWVALPVALKAAADDENEGDCSTEYACGVLACMRDVVFSPVAIFSPRDSFIVAVSMDGETDSAQCS